MGGNWEGYRDKKISKSFSNSIDNQLIVWYNQITIQGLIWKKKINPVSKGGSMYDPLPCSHVSVAHI